MFNKWGRTSVSGFFRLCRGGVGLFCIGRPFGFRIILLSFLVLTAGFARAAPSFGGELQPKAFDVVGIWGLKQAAPALDGSGVSVAVICRSITYIDGKPQNDYQPNARHRCFSNVRFDFHDQNRAPAGISSHSTAICSLLFGKDEDASFDVLGDFGYEGIVPGAKADIYELWHFLTDYVFPNKGPQADVVVASMGSGFEQWWTRGIESMAEHSGLTFVAGIGNGKDAFDPPLYPAAGANVIGVGVVDSVRVDDLQTSLANFALAYPEHSSFGPTAEGRSKPDIVAPGNCMTASAFDNGLYEPAGDWSSYSTPIVAGAAALLIEKAKTDQNLEAVLSPVGRSCLVKAILLNSAKKLPFWHKGRLGKADDHTSPLDYIQGAGLLDAFGAYEQLVAGKTADGVCPETGWDINTVGDGSDGRRVYEIDINESEGKMITATLNWNRHYQQDYPFDPLHQKNADLRLELWAVDANDPNQMFLLDYSDSRCDNLEHIYTAAEPNYSTYRVVVTYSPRTNPNLPPADEPYALAWSVAESGDSDSILRYDINADGVVDDSDIAAVLYNWLETPQRPDCYFIGDINSNGSFDSGDLKLILDNKGRRADWLKN